ncbi:M20 family metallo-hydrolase [Sulfitobacter sp. F26204]|uniref:M20 family metallo-hydrolase n=1 Tax=Sulfitobacter sp. F26204 TaxID=2996014 RepID=UPI00225DF721|nr:M20 family metallo-hydrolase [Sulfitobacter sp. F26204]MCX7561885.1 M20 family metallo-hydrolase [Sulfitobacter sp. F26204]
MTLGETAQSRLSEIAGCSQAGEGVTRLPFTPEHKAALEHILSWMRAAGLDVHMDNAGTMVGRLEGPKGSKTLLIGSHQDSVPSGGRYDGIMGIVLGCLAIEKLQNECITLPLSVEVLAFADEEGVRFPTALLGPRTCAGTFDASALDLADNDGVTLGCALEDFGGDPTRLDQLARAPSDVLGYLEAHIEQGPVLEGQGAPLGVVTGICGIERNLLRFTGTTGHAGTVPMADRQDALVAASRFIAAVSDKANETNAIRATVGSISVHPNAVNAIPNVVNFPLEVRSISDEARLGFTDQMRKLGDQIARDRNLSFEMEQTYSQPAVTCDQGLSNALSAAVESAGHRLITLPSGATHDASAMSDLCPIAMLFVRCKNGLSHHPDEYANAADMNAAIDAIAGFLVSLTPDELAYGDN